MYQVYSSFHIFLKAELCLGGVWGEAADELGWDLCWRIAEIQYYPFLGKFFALFDVYSPLPGVKGVLRYQTPIHGLSGAVQRHVNGKSSSTNKDHWHDGSVAQKCRDWIRQYDGQAKPEVAYCSGTEQHYFERVFMEARGHGDVSVDVQGWGIWTWYTIYLARIVSPPSAWELYQRAMYGASGGARLTLQHRRHMCLDYNPTNKNVYFHSCTGAINQNWCFDGEQIKVKMSVNLCLDYNYRDNSLYMHTCNGGSNQKWYFTSNLELKEKRDGKCIDYNYNTDDGYMHSCHSGWNQKFADSPPQC